MHFLNGIIAHLIFAICLGSLYNSKYTVPSGRYSSHGDNLSNWIPNRHSYSEYSQHQSYRTSSQPSRYQKGTQGRPSHYQNEAESRPSHSEDKVQKKPSYFGNQQQKEVPEDSEQVQTQQYSCENGACESQSQVENGTYSQGDDNPSYSYPQKAYSTGHQHRPPKGVCSLPDDENIVPIYNEGRKQGYAMSPDEQCAPGKWCPYACKPGMYSAQWDPKAKCTSGPQCGSMNGGVFCTRSGKISKPFPKEPLCKWGLRNVYIENRLNSPVSACQTVYPGNEAMLIPTVVQPDAVQVINTPPTSYWLNTSAHYYLNPSGSTSEQCKWGESDEPIGNWAPYLIGAGQGKDGNTFISLNWNPEFVKQKLQSQMSLPHSEYGTPPKKAYDTDKHNSYPTLEARSTTYNHPPNNQTNPSHAGFEPFHIKIECEDDKCLGLPCALKFPNCDTQFCTVTVPPGSSARYVLYRN